MTGLVISHTKEALAIIMDALETKLAQVALVGTREVYLRYKESEITENRLVEAKNTINAMEVEGGKEEGGGTGRREGTGMLAFHIISAIPVAITTYYASYPYFPSFPLAPLSTAAGDAAPCQEGRGPGDAEGHCCRQCCRAAEEVEHPQCPV